MGILDSSLFESLSRDLQFLFGEEVLLLQIALFHVIGLVCALYFKIDKNQK